MSKTKVIEKPKCKSCKSGQVYVLVNGTIVCRLCGHREPKK